MSIKMQQINDEVISTVISKHEPTIELMLSDSLSTQYTAK